MQPIFGNPDWINYNEALKELNKARKRPGNGKTRAENIKLLESRVNYWETKIGKKQAPKPDH